MSDYRVKIKVLNARMLRRIESKGERAGNIFAEKCGIKYWELVEYLNLKRSPLEEDGMYRESAIKICAFLNCTPSDLWSEEQLEPLEKNTGFADVELEGIAAVIAASTKSNDPQQIIQELDDANVIKKAMKERLTKREISVIYSRYFDDLTLEEKAGHDGVTRERIRQMESKAIRKLSYKGANKKFSIKLDKHFSVD